MWIAHMIPINIINHVDSKWNHWKFAAKIGSPYIISGPQQLNLSKPKDIHVQQLNEAVSAFPFSYIRDVSAYLHIQSHPCILYIYIIYIYIYVNVCARNYNY